MKVRFWGVRGSIPVPGPTTVRYGGNTSCLEVIGDAGEQIILEAGSGLRVLGLDLMSRGPLPHLHLFISHTHWDHIQGFPFFVPAYIPGTKIDVRGPVHFVENKPLQDAFDIQMRYEFFPISNEQLGADITYEAIKEESFTVGNLTIDTIFTNHPIRSCGYRIREGDRQFFYSGDHEPYFNMFASDDDDGDEDDDLLFGDVDTTVDDANQRFVDFIEGSDTIVLDCQYTPDEYHSSKRNWGHSSWDYCLNWFRDSKSKRMILTHHEPVRNDDQLDENLKLIRAAGQEMGLDPDNILLSYEGLELEI